MSSQRSSIGLRGAALLAVFALITLSCSFSLGNPDIGAGQPPATRAAPRPTLRPVNTRPPDAGAPENGPAEDEPQDAAQETPQIPQTGQEAESPGGVVLQAPETLPQLYEQVSPGAVSIMVSANRGGQMGGGEGSGFILSEDGYIATNSHVVEGGDTFIVRFFNDVDALAELVGADPDSDLAILRVEDMPESAYPLPLGDSDAVLVGEPVVAIGNPLGIGTSMSYGIVSALDRVIPSLTEFNIPEAIQTDAPINPGNSGGPLINMRGEVIGVNAQIRTTQGGGSIGIGFAIPVNILKLVYPSLIETGSYSWSYLGVSSQIESPLAVQPSDIEAQQGAHIDAVEPGGPADQGGLADGDVVIAADGQEINSFDDLLSYIAFKRPGDQVELVVLRNGQEGQITVTLGERPSGGVQ